MESVAKIANTMAETNSSFIILCSHYITPGLISTPSRNRPSPIAATGSGMSPIHLRVSEARMPLNWRHLAASSQAASLAASSKRMQGTAREKEPRAAATAGRRNSEEVPKGSLNLRSSKARMLILRRTWKIACQCSMPIYLEGTKRVSIRRGERSELTDLLQDAAVVVDDAPVDRLLARLQTSLSNRSPLGKEAQRWLGPLMLPHLMRVAQPASSASPASSSSSSLPAAGQTRRGPFGHSWWSRCRGRCGRRFCASEARATGRRSRREL